MNSCFCSSVPHCRMVGPTSVSPKKSARSGAPARWNSSASTTDSMVDRPLPPYSLGHDAQIQPPSNSVVVHCFCHAAFSSADIVKSGSNQPSGRLSSSQVRISLRKVSASGGYVRSMVPMLTGPEQPVENLMGRQVRAT